MPATTMVRSRSGQRTANWSAVIAPIENPRRWKCDAERVGECREIVDQPAVGPAGGRVPAGRPWPRASGRKTRNAFAKSGTWAAKSSAPGDVAPWSMISGGPAPCDLVADVQAVGADRRHAPAQPSGLPSTGPSPRLLDAQVAAPVVEQRQRVVLLVGERIDPPDEQVVVAGRNGPTTVHSSDAIAPSRSGRPDGRASRRPAEVLAARLTGAPAKQSDSACWSSLRMLTANRPGRADDRGDEPPAVERHHHQRRFEADTELSALTVIPTGGRRRTS